VSGRLESVILALLAVCSTATAQQRPRPVEHAGVPVRYPEGAQHGFVALRTATGAVLAHGDLLQVPRGRQMESRLVFHFTDASVFEETVLFTQHDVFALENYHLVQSGPAFDNDLDVTLSRSGRYVIKTKSHKDGEEKQYTGTMDLPPDIYNGMIITIARNLAPRASQTVHIVAFTPKPLVIGLEIAPVGSQRVLIGQHAETAVHFKLKPKLGAALKLFATLLGKAPPDSDIWVVADDVPAFVRFEGPLYSGPVWRIDLTSPTWPP
jgi:hypothetical protein